jgi:hypothetical protein
MKNVEKLKEIGILGEVRQRLGAEDENDSGEDDRIERLDNVSLVAKWAGWYLGDDEWAREIIRKYKDLELFNEI